MPKPNDAGHTTSSAVRPRSSIKRLLLFWTVLSVFMTAAFEASCWLALLALEHFYGVVYEPVPKLRDDHRLIIERVVEGAGWHELSPTLGWRPKADLQGISLTSLVSTWKAQTNDKGMRAYHEYTPTPDESRMRIATFGDSFVFGNEVSDPYTFQEYLSRLEPDVEMLNFGVPAFGPGQAFLRYREEAERFHPDVVVIGFMSENINRSVNVFRPLYPRGPGVPLAKPRFAIREGELTLIPNPLPTTGDYQALLDDPEAVMTRLGRDDYFYSLRPREGPLDFLPSMRLFKLTQATYFPKKRVIRGGYYNTDGEPFRVTTAILDAFHEQIEDDGAVPLILVFPDRSDVERYRANGTTKYQPLLDHFENRGFRYVDVMTAFEDREKAPVVVDLFKKMHYSEIGNRLLAEYLLQYLHSTDMLASQSGESLPPATAMALKGRRKVALRQMQSSLVFEQLSPDVQKGLLGEIRAGYEPKIAAARARARK